MKDTIGIKDTMEYYDDFSIRYDIERERGYFEFITNLEINTIITAATGKKTLEIGCGTGLILENINKIASKAYGVDVSEGMLKISKTKGLRVFKGSATELPFNDSAFDLTYSFKVLPHIPDIKKALAEIIRVTRPNGRMVLEFYNPLSLKAIGDRFRKYIYKKEPVYLRHDFPKRIRNMLPSNTKLLRTRGIRIFGPTAACYSAPILGALTKKMDRLACDGPFKIFGGYYIFEIMVKDTCTNEK